MRIYKEKNRGKLAAVWTVSISDQHGGRRKFAGFADKATTQEFGRKLERLVATRIAGREPDGELTRWLEHIPQGLRKRLVNYGLLNIQAAEAGKPLAITKKDRRGIVTVTGGHLHEYQTHMQRREFTPGHIKTVISYCVKLLQNQRCLYPSDITTSAVEAEIAAKRRDGASARTANAILAAIKSFCNWMVREGRLGSNPASRISKMNQNADKRRPRRALTQEEIAKLISATDAGGDHHALTGRQRALVYRLALSTGLRYSEIRTLSISDFWLQGNAPCVTIRAENEKAGRGDVLPLKQELARDLSAYFGSQPSLLPTATLPAFPGMWKAHGVRMLRRDLDDAGIDWRPNASGEVLDFHSLRHTFGTLLARSGIHPKIAQDLMRHSSIDLTMNLYTHTVLDDRARAMQKLPEFGGQTGEAGVA